MDACSCQNDGQRHHTNERGPWKRRQGTANPSLVRKGPPPMHHLDAASTPNARESMKLSTKSQGELDFVHCGGANTS